VTKIRAVLIVLLALGGLTAVMVAAQRWSVERKNRTVELVADYEEIVALATDEGCSVDEALRRLKDAGLTSVAIREETLTDLVNQGRAALWKDEASLPGYEAQPGGNSLLIQIDEKHDYNRFHRVHEQLRYKYAAGLVELVPQGDSRLLRVREARDRLARVGLGLPYERIQQAGAAKLRVVARLQNYPGLTPEAARYMLEQVRQWPIDKVIFFGDEVLGYRDLIPEVAAACAGDAGSREIICGVIEFAKQAGEDRLARELGARIVRVHSINEREMLRYEPLAAAERFVRAARERNIRVCFVRLFLAPQKDKLATNEKYLQLLRARMEAAGLACGSAQPFSVYVLSPWILFGVGLGVLAGGLWLLNRLWPLSPEACWTLLGGGMVILLALVFAAPGLGRKLLALAATILFPTWAGLFAWQVASAEPDDSALKKRMWRSAVALWRTTGLTLIGSLYVVGLLSETAFFVKVDWFTGVKLSLLLPLLLVATLVLAGLANGEPAAGRRPRQQLAEFLNQPLRLGHAILAGLVLVAAVIFVLRTGNEGLEINPVEMKFRDALERVLIARPRTKEFLLGHPVLMLTFALAAFGQRRWLLPGLLIGLVGQVSTSNTFTHLHTPLAMSLLRTFHALWLGTLLGAGLIALVAWVQGRGGGQRTQRKTLSSG